MQLDAIRFFAYFLMMMGHQLTLQSLAMLLEEYGKTLSNYGLPMPVSFSMEVAHEIEHWRSQADSLVTRAHDAIDRFKPRQQAIYLKVQHLLESHNTLCFFIDGKAGCGKTTLINTICDILQSQGKIVLATATSTFAAQLYAGGRTTHSTFKVIDIISSKSHSPF